MKDIEALFQLDIQSVLLSFFLIIVGIVALMDVIAKFSIHINKPVRWIKKRDEDHLALQKALDSIKNFEEKYDKEIKETIESNNLINTKLENLTTLFMDTQIDTMRWEILNFASDLSNGKTFNRESYAHVLRIYDKYEKILTENGLENGLVDESMKFVNERYREDLKNGNLR